MPVVILAPGVGQAIRASLAEAGVHGPLRIEIRSSGCCDPSLGLAVDTIRESDLVEEVEGLTFVVSRETHDLVGNVTISNADGGFVLTSNRPLSEWDGFATCRITVSPA